MTDDDGVINRSPWRPPLRTAPVELLDEDEELDVEDSGGWPVVSRETWDDA